MNYQFPPAKFDCGIMEQLNKIGEEQSEAVDAYADAFTMRRDPAKETALAMELWDVVHAAETALRMLDPQTVLYAKCECEHKNWARGYYD